MSDEPVKTKWYEEAPGETSSMRVAMMLCICIAGYLAIAGLHKGADMIQLSAVIAMFLGAGVGGKQWQKGKE